MMFDRWLLRLLPVALAGMLLVVDWRYHAHLTASTTPNAAASIPLTPNEQDSKPGKTAEEALKLIEENIEKTPAFSFIFWYELQIGTQAIKGAGSLHVKKGNKVKYSTRAGSWWICNNGRFQESRSRVYDEGILAPEFRRQGRIASNNFERNIRAMVVRLGTGLNDLNRIPFEPEEVELFGGDLR